MASITGIAGRVMPKYKIIALSNYKNQAKKNQSKNQAKKSCNQLGLINVIKTHKIFKICCAVNCCKFRLSLARKS